MLLAIALAASTFPAFTGYVVDQAGVLGSGATARIEAVASELDRAGVAQIAVATVPRGMLDDASKEEYAAELFRRWGLGHGKKKADGVLVLLVPRADATQKRLLKVEVGYGLEGVLPDGRVGALEDEQAVPYLRRDDYGGAASHLVDGIAAVLRADAAQGGDAAPGTNTLRGGARRGMPGAVAVSNPAGLGAGGLCMGAVRVVLLTGGARRRVPGREDAPP